MPPAITRTRRARQIAEVLLRHGLGYLVSVSGLDRFVPLHRGLLGHPRRAEPYAAPEHLRMALDELGAAWIKLGQFLATRADLLPPSYQRELAKLQDAAAPVPGEVAQAIIETELGRSLTDLFAHFDPQPLAAASIGQAHAATLTDGTEVVVKVRRPGVVEQVEQDLELLLNLAHTANRHWELAETYDIVGIVQEFALTLRAELDYLREGRNAERFAQHFAHNPTVHIPRVFWDYTTSRVLTLERIRGIKIDHLEALDAAGFNRTELAERVARILLQMVFEDGFFHADPHPGNFFVEADGTIGLIDFGMVGTVDAPTQDRLALLLLAIAQQDPDRLVDAFLELGVARGHVDRLTLREDLRHFLLAYYDRPLRELRLEPLLKEALTIVRRHHLHLPTNLVLLLKTVTMAEGLAAQLAPDFQVAELLPDYIHRLLLHRYRPRTWLRRLGWTSLEAAEFGLELPRQLRRLLRALEQGTLQLGMRPEGFEPLIARLERLTNRLVLGIITAAFIVGLAVLMTTFRLPGVEHLIGPAFGLGFLLTALLAAYLIWVILRSGRI
ncbi:ABC1 kinase family protein [Rhodothermus profundi]|uniref:Ubiquinone biosynthesis protein n=1 Tax=Rhodothermus profundi TaxID=633813 RepID=A0A1M6Q255_9BACT|nr:AarF/ABC1/UbiB kinase family protein [Rhodothermus profundi]SHK14315.1 ubiquinone biosynthesis protein [Rhodothermus profundi]